MNAHWYAVVMAGGAGTRFWPASRKNRPKQFLALGKRTDEVMIQSTVRRLRALCDPSRILIATGKHLASDTAKLLPDIPAANILAEPVPRNTAPCIAWATATIARRDPDAIVAVLSADHLAEDETAFTATIDHAMRVASSGIITTVGVVPTRPETGYGYIEAGAVRSDGAHQGVRFVEKPNLARAQEMLASGQFLWNSGFFFFRAQQLLDAVTKFLPKTAEGIRHINEQAACGNELPAVDQWFPTLDATSIDYGIMEKIDTFAVVRGQFGWTDVGSWQTVWELADRDSNDNAAPQSAILIDAQGNIVSNVSSHPNKAIALLGVQGLVVVETDDALLVMPRALSQDVRKVVAALSERGQTDKL